MNRLGSNTLHRNRLRSHMRILTWMLEQGIDQSCAVLRMHADETWTLVWAGDAVIEEAQFDAEGRVVYQRHVDPH